MSTPLYNHVAHKVIEACKPILNHTMHRIWDFVWQKDQTSKIVGNIKKKLDHKFCDWCNQTFLPLLSLYSARLKL